MRSVPAPYGAVPAQGRPERSSHVGIIIASAGLCCAVLCSLSVLSPDNRAGWSSLLGVAGRGWARRTGGAPRQQELSDVFTAPIENAARSLGDSLARAVKDGSTLSSLDQEQGVPTWQDSAELSVGAVDTAGDYKCFIESDFYLKYMRTCCKTMYWPPSAQSALPELMTLPLSPAQSPADLGQPFGVRFRYFLGDGNDIVFNGGTDDTIRFINRFFGYEIKTTPVKHRFTRKAQAYVNGEPLAHILYQDVLHLMPQSLPNYEGITAVDVASLPQGESTVIYDDVPPGNHWDPTEHEVASPGFRLKYCEAADHLGDLNGGLPMKIRPADCDQIAKKYNMQCKCGNIFFLGWVWPKAEENIYEKSLMRMDKLALHACPKAPPTRALPMPRIAPNPQPPADPLSACKDAPSYDAAAQNWYYNKQDGTRMVRHWCPSAYAPQEQWYKYQRYVPRTNNNLPAPPINDFDFLNSFGRDYYKESRAKGRYDANAGTFDDFTLGNFGAQAYKYSAGIKKAAFDDFALGSKVLILSRLCNFAHMFSHVNCWLPTSQKDTHTHMNTCTHTQTRTCTRSCTHTDTHTSLHLHARTCTYTYTHLHLHTQLYTRNTQTHTQPHFVLFCSVGVLNHSRCAATCNRIAVASTKQGLDHTCDKERIQSIHTCELSTCDMVPGEMTPACLCCRCRRPTTI